MTTAVTISAVLTVILGFIGQSLFLPLYWTRPWKHYRVTQALMLKSITIWLVFLRDLVILVTLQQVLVATIDNVALHVFVIVVNALLVVAIWFQFFALLGEVRDGLAEAETTP
jgi:hypothetical protein